MFLSYQLRGSYELVPLPVISRAVVTAESYAANYLIPRANYAHYIFVCSCTALYGGRVKRATNSHIWGSASRRGVAVRHSSPRPASHASSLILIVYYGEKRVIHLSSCLQLVGEPIEMWRGAPWSWSVARVVTNHADRESASKGRGARAAMQRQHVEGDSIAWLQCPPENLVRLHVWHVR